MLNARDRLAYTARQGARVAWYMGHYLASERFREADPDVKMRRGPKLERIIEEMGRLFARDLDNAERGLYPLPRDRDGDVWAASRAYFADLPVAARRKAKNEGREVFSPDLAREFPAYFLQNFHFQTGGYLTEESASLYDMQVEVLFSGCANAMRRQCLVPIAKSLFGKDQRGKTLLDAACGTGRFARFAKEAFPRLQVSGLDLSPAYLAEAARHGKPYPIDLKSGKAEALPYPDASFDFVTSIFLFHETPPEVRRAIASEFARVLKSNGILVFMDSLQLGDKPEFDGLLESFPAHFHEPYYAGYLADPVEEIFTQAGFKAMSSEPVFLAKMAVAQACRPDPGGAEIGQQEQGLTSPRRPAPP